MEVAIVEPETNLTTTFIASAPQIILLLLESVFKT